MAAAAVDVEDFRPGALIFPNAGFSGRRGAFFILRSRPSIEKKGNAEQDDDTEER